MHALRYIKPLKGKGAFINVFNSIDRSALILLFHQIIYDFYLNSVTYSFQKFITKLQREMTFYKL